MRSAKAIAPVAGEAYFHQFDLRDLDAADPQSFWRLQYLRRVDGVLGAVRAHVPPGGSVLEIGSAQANMSLMLAEEGYRATAVDLSPAAISYSRKRYEKGDVSWRCGNAFDMDFDATFDAVILAELVEHVAEPAHLMRRAWKLVATAGVLIVTTPNGGAVPNRLPSYGEAAQDMERLKSEQFGPGGEHHLFALSMAELLSLAPAGAVTVERRWLCSLAINSHVQPLLRRRAGRRALTALAGLTETTPLLRERLTNSILLVLRKPAGAPTQIGQLP
jgi:2-polyprenyl-3-methyl-5-hydroxy-6-metoxy-1,4-benzoquinol methylase